MQLYFKWGTQVLIKSASQKKIPSRQNCLIKFPKPPLQSRDVPSKQDQQPQFPPKVETDSVTSVGPLLTVGLRFWGLWNKHLHGESSVVNLKTAICPHCERQAGAGARESSMLDQCSLRAMAGCHICTPTPLSFMWWDSCSWSTHPLSSRWIALIDWDLLGKMSRTVRLKTLWRSSGCQHWPGR